MPKPIPTSVLQMPKNTEYGPKNSQNIDLSGISYLS